MASTEEVTEFLGTMFRLQSSDEGAAGSKAAGAGASALQLHPRLDASLPCAIRASSAEQLHAALAAYRWGLTGVRLEVLDVLADGNTALVTGEQVVYSRLATWGDALVAAAPPPVARWAGALLPRFTEGRVPTTVALTVGKNDAGDPVVTRLDVSFYPPSALAPHVALAPWQRRALERGLTAAVAEDAWTAAAAAWRAGGALGTPAFEAAAGAFWEVVKTAGAAALSAAKNRAGGFVGGGAAGGEEALEVVGLVPASG